MANRRNFAQRAIKSTTPDNVIPFKDGLGTPVALDAFTNVGARMGYGTPSLSEDTEYNLVRWSQNYWLMITLFRNHWIARRICEKPAQDMCKAWPKIQSTDLKPADIDDFDRAIRRTMTPMRIQEAITWARLFGGAGALMVIDGHEGMLDKPLRLDDINPGTYKGLIVFDRWSGITPGDEISDDINSPVDFGLPTWYLVQAEDGPAFRIHASRILRFCGPRVPRPENQAQLHWGISELEICFEELKKRDNASWAVLSLMYRANIIAQKNTMLSQITSGLGATGDAAKKYAQIMEAQNQLLSNQSMLLLPETGDMQTFSYSFAGISEVQQNFEISTAGAARMPVAILFGKTATGLGQSNDGEIRLYEQEIGQKQNEEMRPQLDKLYPVVCMSVFGEVPDDLDIMFPAVRVLTEEEKGKLATDKVTAIMAPFSAGVTSQQLTLQELKSQANETGLFDNIDDGIIAAADDKPNPGEMELGGDDSSEGADGFDALPMSEYTVQGLDIFVETAMGETRSGKDFKVIMPYDYGYVKDSIGADGDEMDCYIGPNIHSSKIFVVNQSKIGQNDVFDEHKCMIGFDSKQAALQAFLAGHHVGKDIYMSIVPMTMDAFKNWLASGKTKTILGKN